MKNETLSNDTPTLIQCVLKDDDTERYLLLTPEQIKLFNYLKRCDVVYDSVELEVYSEGIAWETV